MNNIGLLAFFLFLSFFLYHSLPFKNLHTSPTVVYLKVFILEMSASFIFSAFLSLNWFGTEMWHITLLKASLPLYCLYGSMPLMILLTNLSGIFGRKGP